MFIPGQMQLKRKMTCLEEILVKATVKWVKCASDGYFRNFYQERDQKGEEHVILSASCGVEIHHGDAFL